MMEGRGASAIVQRITIEELTPEAAAILESLINNPHPIPDGPVLQSLLAERLVIGSPDKVHATSRGLQLLAEYIVKTCPR